MDFALPYFDIAHPVIRHCITATVALTPPLADAIQLRAKGVPARELLERAKQIRSSFKGLLLVNDRIDVCLAAGADGIHLPSHRIAPQRIKRRFGKNLIIGVSCHDLDELRRAEQEGADYAYLSPIFSSASKPGYGPPLGLKLLADAVMAVRIPILALGGITPANEAQCIEAGAAGIAGISYFGYS